MICNCSTENFLTYEENLIFFFISVLVFISLPIAKEQKIPNIWASIALYSKYKILNALWESCAGIDEECCWLES
jgi:hypothetical protein